MEEEIEALVRNNTWKIINLLEGQNYWLHVSAYMQLNTIIMGKFKGIKQGFLSKIVVTYKELIV